MNERKELVDEPRDEQLIELGDAVKETKSITVPSGLDQSFPGQRM